MKTMRLSSGGPGYGPAPKQKLRVRHVPQLRCPECMSEQVTLQHWQTFMANTMEHYCHSMKTQDDDSPSRCLDCQWVGLHRDLNGYGEQL